MFSIRTKSTILLRFYSTATSHPPKVPISLISSLRSQRPGTPLSLARTALQSSDPPLSLESALKWIEQQAIQNGEAKAKKLSTRQANEGLVGVVVLNDGFGTKQGGVRMAIVELSCETDFVGRTDEFRETTMSVANSLAFMAEEVATSSNGPTFSHHTYDTLSSLPLLPTPSSSSSTSSETLSTVSSSLQSLVSRLGENITLRRAATLSIPPPSLGSTESYYLSTFIHGASPISGANFESGRIAGVLLFKMKDSAKGKEEPIPLKTFGRALSRQVVALPTTAVSPSSTSASTPTPTETNEGEPSPFLYSQQLITMMPSSKFEFEQGATVLDVLKRWTEGSGKDVEVSDLVRWEVGGE